MWFQSPASICVQWSVWHWVLSMFDEGRTDYLLQKLLLCTFVSILKQFILTQLVWSWYFCRVDCSFVNACGQILIFMSIRYNSPAWAPFPLVCFKTKYQRLTIRVARSPSPRPLGSVFRDFFLCVKKQVFFRPKTLLVGQNFHIRIWSGLRGLTPHPLLSAWT